MGEILWAVDYRLVQNKWVENRGFTPAFFIFSQKDKKRKGRCLALFRQNNRPRLLGAILDSATWVVVG
jgi:hypothetical protein